MRTGQKKRYRSVEEVREQCAQYLSQVASYQDLTLKRLAAWTSTTQEYLLEHIYPSPTFPQLRDEWARQRLRPVMTELYLQARTRGDFSARQIARQTGISVTTFFRLLRQEWYELFIALPTPREHLMTVVGQLVEVQTPLHLFTRERIAELAGVKTCPTGGWFSALYRKAYLTLRQRQEVQTSPPPEMTNARLVAGVWIDLDSDAWDLRGAHQRVLRKDQLRPDIAAIVWPLLREELRTGEREPATVADLHRAFLAAEKVLGEMHSDVRLVSLEALQRAWLVAPGSLTTRRFARLGLLRIFETLEAGTGSEQTEAQQEWLRTTRWLRDLVSLPHNEPAANFLSEEELNTILTCCFADIQAGLAFIQTAPDLSFLNSREHPQEGMPSPRALVYWAVALMILVMACTGLRRQSILALEIHDWIELHPGLFGVVWRHWKKGEEHLATLSPTVARHLQQYVADTTELRTSFQTKKVFLNGNPQGLWEPMRPATWEKRLEEFVQRHRIERNGTALKLGSTIFRRTFTTRALYEGQRLEVLRSQLGHTSIVSTLLYSKLALFEHPAQVRPALDLYGRHALSLWKTPLLLDELSAEERISLLQNRQARDQEVGLCRHEQCVQLGSGGIPPCSLCEHLVTGKPFLVAWKAEKEAREETLRRLAATKGAEMLLVQMKGQFAQFKRNLDWVAAHCGEEREHGRDE